MNCLEETPTCTESESFQRLGALFAIALASSDEGLLPQLPETLGTWLQAAGVRLLIDRWDGVIVHDYIFEETDATGRGRADEKPWVRFERSLGDEFKLTISIHTAASTGPRRQPRCLHQVLEMIHAALENLFIGQNDRESLGSPFNLLTDREWQVCQVLVGSSGEKEIAEQLGWSRHTLHTKVKRVYRKLDVRSRLEMVDRLRQARLKIRQEAVKTLAKCRRTDLTGDDDNRNDLVSDMSPRLDEA